MIVSKLMFCAEGIVRDTETNNISAFNILEQLTSPGFPFFFPRLYCLTRLNKSPEDSAKIQCSLIVENNGDKFMDDILVEVDFQNKLIHRSIVIINGIVIPQPGILRFKFLHSDEVLDSYDIAVKKEGEPTIEVKTAPP